VSFSAARATARPGRLLAAIELDYEPLARAAAEAALRLLEAARDDRPFALAEELPRLRELAEQPLAAGAQCIYLAARARGIPAARLSPDYRSCLRLGQGARQHRCRGAETDTVSCVARMASTDKHLAKQLLQAAGVPVPRGRLAETAEAAWAAACEVGLPVAIKPVDCDTAIGVSLDLRSREQVEAGFGAARAHSSEVLVERFAPGREHRVLVVDDHVAAVTRIDPPQVVGDGVATVAELVERVNRDPRRGEGGPLHRLKLDETGLAVLAGQGCTPASVPHAGERVLVRRNPPYFTSGGNLVDLTDQIHPSTAAHAVAAAQALQIAVAGVDVVAVDISRPLEEQGGVVVEVNVSPGLWLHLAPKADSPRPVGEAIVASLFPPGADGRIPVVAVVGSSPGPGSRRLAALLAGARLRAGTVGAAEITLGQRRWPAPDGGPQERAAALLQNPTVDVALLETTPQELARAGFGNDRCDVALLLDSQADTGSAAADEGEEMAPEAGDYLRTMRNALAPQGVFVAPAEASWGPAEAPPAARLFLVAADGEGPRVRAHVAAGGRALVVRGETVALLDGAAAVELGRCPEDVAGAELTELLAALAAGLGLGLKVEMLRERLRSLS
jgi:cyanophycin synthetase